MRLYKDIVVDLYHPYPLPVMEAKQYDTGRGARVTLVADGAVLVPTDETIQIYVNKSDGTQVNATCTLESDYILVDFPDQTFTVAGTMEAELYMDDGSNVLSTPIFEILTNPSAVNTGGITSSDEFVALVDALRDVEVLKKTGLKGDQGPAGTMRIGTVTASDPGSTPTVTNSGTASNAVLNFVLPRGEQGPRGANGSVDTLEEDLALTDADITEMYNNIYSS